MFSSQYKKGEISSSLFGESTEDNKLFTTKHVDTKLSKSAEKKKEIDQKPVETKDVDSRTIHKQQEVPDYVNMTPEQIKERNGRTVFVGNIPFDKEVRKLNKKLHKLFNDFDVESIRVRGIPITDTKEPKRAAVYHKQFSELRKNVNAYVTLKSKDQVEKALELNRFVFEGNHLIVDYAEPKDLTKSECRKSVFIGNIPFDAEEEDIFKAFEKKKVICQKVRLVRDKISSIGKGFGFVGFEDQETAKKAVGLKNKIKIKDRYIRITHANYNIDEKEKKKVDNEKRKKMEKNNVTKPWKVVNSISNDVARPEGDNKTKKSDKNGKEDKKRKFDDKPESRKKKKQ